LSFQRIGWSRKAVIDVRCVPFFFLQNLTFARAAVFPSIPAAATV